MKKVVTVLFLVGLICPLWLGGQQSKRIQGTVSDGKKPLEDVEVRIQGKESRTFTDSTGFYQIQAKTGDLLTYSYAGMRDYFARVEDVTRYLNLVMIPDVEQLPEVTVTGSSRKSQRDLAVEYASNPRILKTAFGYLDVDTAPGKVRVLPQEAINPVGICLLNVIRNRFSGVRVRGNCRDGGDVIVRGPGSISGQWPATYDIDGQIFTETPIWLDISQIKRLAIVSSIAFSSRYGTLGKGGVVIINTFTGNPQDPRITDTARLRNNYYKGGALDQAAVRSDLPTYLTALQETTSFSEAREVYSRYEARYRSSPYFFLDAYRHFYDRLGETAFADQLIEANFKRFKGNAVLLKALAYLYQEQGRSREALETMKEVFVLRPHYSQSYVDLANAYRDAGQYEKAAGMFSRYRYLVDENFLVASEDFSLIAQHESDNLLQFHGREIGIGRDQVSTDPYVEQATRVTLEWNDTEAEFMLQFVNPETQYHTWKHTYADNEERVLDEKLKGYSMQEFIIDSALPGVWSVNLYYLGNKSLTPTYLKMTIYYNYGEGNQRKEVRTFKLQLKDRWQELSRIQIPVARDLR